MYQKRFVTGLYFDDSVLFTTVNPIFEMFFPLDLVLETTAWPYFGNSGMCDTSFGRKRFVAESDFGIRVSYCLVYSMLFSN